MRRATAPRGRAALVWLAWLILATAILPLSPGAYAQSGSDTKAAAPPAPDNIAAASLEAGKEAEKRKDYAEAMRWYGKAAEQGETTAQNNIGAFYDRGYGVTQDYGEAARWYRMAADHGNIDAEYNLALLYADGHGEARDLGQARQWMQKAADAGDFQAKQWLGVHRE